MAKHIHKKVKKYPTKSLLSLMTSPEKMFYNGKEIPYVPLFILHESKENKSGQASPVS